MSGESAGEGKGATFTVKLPLLMADEQAVGDVQPKPVAGLGLRVEPSLLLMAWRILVVDDEADARDLISTMLTSCGASLRLPRLQVKHSELIAKWKPRYVDCRHRDGGRRRYALIRKLRALSRVRAELSCCCSDRVCALKIGNEHCRQGFNCPG